MGRKEDNVRRAQALFSELGQIRNIGTAAHIDHGKTTLSDNLIYGAGMMSEELAGKQLMLDFDEQGEGLVDPYTADLTTEGGAPVDEGPKVVDTRDSAVARDDGVFGAPQLDGFEFEGWTPKKVQEALASGWTIEQLREHYKQRDQ